MKLSKRYNIFVDEFGEFRARHHVGGSLVLFLMNMGFWNIASKFSNDNLLSNFYTQLLMSAAFTIVFYPRKKSNGLDQN